jgi:hypothetical protein
MPQQSNIPITVDNEYLIDALGLAAGLPGASRGATKLTNEAADALVRAITRNPKATAPGVLEAAGQMLPMSRITTYHGSPYLFREFDPARVGTGEGEQAYGVGAGYTAEARPVAEEYRRVVQADKSGGYPSFLARSSYAESGGDKEKAAASLNESIARLERDRGFLRNAMNVDEAIQSYQDALKVLKDIQPNQNYLYKGEIPDEILPSFLDWDKPLSEQSKEIQDVAKELLPKLRTVNPDIKLDNMTGEGLYRSYQAYRGNQPDFATEGLQAIGVRGIRYLDQGSRGVSGRGTSNFIPFRPEDYRIQEINDIPIEQYMEQGLL